MQIHVVQQGQSLFGIAQAYNTTVNDLIEANEIPNPNRLVVGQTLVIPIIGRFYWVQPGDSLFSIAQRFGITIQQLALNKSNLYQQSSRNRYKTIYTPIAKSNKRN